MQVAAALGPRSSEAVVRRVSELPEDALRVASGQPRSADPLVRIDSDIAGFALSSEHEMVRQVTYESMVEKVRESVHARVLAAFENDDILRDDPDALCYHAMRAKGLAQGVQLRRIAAQKCLLRSAYADAVDYFRTAMSSLDKTPITSSRETNFIDSRMEARMAFIWSGGLPSGSIWERKLTSGPARSMMLAEGCRQDGHGGWAELLWDACGGRYSWRGGRWSRRESGQSRLAQPSQYNLGQAYFLAGRYREAERTMTSPCPSDGPGSECAVRARPRNTPSCSAA